MTATPADTQQALDAKGLESACREYVMYKGRHPDAPWNGKFGAASQVEIETPAISAAIRAYLATTRAPGEGEPVADARILEFGKGELVVDTGTYLDKPCVFICAAKTPGEVGASAKREGHDKHSLQPHEVVLVFPTMEQADAVDAALIPYTAPPALASPSYAQPAPCPKCAGTKFLDKGGARAAIQRTPCPDCAQPALADLDDDYAMRDADWIATTAQTAPRADLVEAALDITREIATYNPAWIAVARQDVIARAKKAIAAISDAPREAEGLAELVAPLIAAWEGFKQSDANMEQAYYRLAKHQWSNWEALASALSAAPKREG